MVSSSVLNWVRSDSISAFMRLSAAAAAGEDAQSSDPLPGGQRDRRTRVEPNGGSAGDQRVVRKALIQGRIGDLEGFVPADRVATECRAMGCLRDFRQTDIGFERLPVYIDQADQ
jgi:hypothetical protein